MSARPDTWMPLYVGDYLGDTMHLTTVQHGAYLLLIMAYWRRGQPLPDDDAQLAAIVRATPAEWRKHRGVLAAFFEIADGIWRHHRIDAELANAVGNTQSRSDAGRNAARVRWERERNANGMRDASLTHAPSPSPSPSPSPEKERTPARGKPRAGLTAEELREFEEWYAIYPLHVGRIEAEHAFRKARKIASLEQLIAGAKRYAHSVTDPKFTAHPATWLNAGRWSDEGPAASANGLAVSQRRAPTGPPPPLQPGWDRDL